MNTDHYLTAEEARKLSATWPDSNLEVLIEETLKKIESKARKGYRTIFIDYENCTKPNVHYISVMKELGYKLYCFSDGYLLEW